MQANRRLMNNIAKLGDNPPPGVVLLDSEHMGNLSVLITAPEDSVYKTGMFNVSLSVDVGEYPIKAPLVNIINPIFHPNVSPADGEVCVDIFKDKWKPTISLAGCCMVLQQLFRDPNPKSPLFSCPAKMMRDDQVMFKKTVEVWTSQFAGGSVEPDAAYLAKISELKQRLSFRSTDKDIITELSKAYWNVDEAYTKLSRYFN